MTPPDPWNAANGEAGATGPAGPAGSAEPEVEDTKVDEPEKPSPGPVAALFGLVRELVLVLVIALGLSLLIKTFLVQAFFIPSPSMENTLLTGDRVLVSKLTPGPFDLHRGDIVVFKDRAAGSGTTR